MPNDRTITPLDIDRCFLNTTLDIQSVMNKHESSIKKDSELYKAFHDFLDSIDEVLALTKLPANLQASKEVIEKYASNLDSGN